MPPPSPHNNSVFTEQFATAAAAARVVSPGELELTGYATAGTKRLRTGEADVESSALVVVMDPKETGTSSVVEETVPEASSQV
jgi:hypothetical protein